MQVFFATDHAGFELKESLLIFVREELGHEVIDLGAFAYEPEDDYPALIAEAARRVQFDVTARAIVLGGSGQGEAMAANRFSGVRAAVYYGGPLELVTLSREHNDANVLSLGARFVNQTEAEDAVRQWLGAEFSADERHVRRIRSLDEIA